jgi:outer membrane protein TolC
MTQIRGQQMVSSVYLAKALGGGWNADEIRDVKVHPEARQALQP